MGRIGCFLVSACLLGGAILWQVAMPRKTPDRLFDTVSGDARRGSQIFAATGCASCHMAPGAKGEAQLVLSGGQAFSTAFGTFFAPNISQDPEAGIGGWSLADLGSALLEGTSPEGRHLYPALPYWSYSRMTPQDIADLQAFLVTLPADPTPSLPHDLGFPFNIRMLLGGWKFLNLDDDFVIQRDLTGAAARGRYIVEAMAHCGECHTPRNLIGGLDTARWLAGAPNPDGKGSTPNITPARLRWSEDEIVEYLTSGFTPEYDSVGGHMAHVVENMARLPEDDRRAIAVYLKAIPPVE